MSRMLRVHKIDQMLHNRSYVSIQDFIDELEVSLPTFKRDLEFMRLHLNAPIVFDRVHKAYRFDTKDLVGPRYELPGLWLDPSEASALLTAHSLLESLEPRLLGPRVGPIKDLLIGLIAQNGVEPNDIAERIQVIPSLRRQSALREFQVIASAALMGKRIRVRLIDPLLQEPVTRIQSPQRLTYYRENWFLDAWCHDQQAFRNVAIDAIESAEVLDDPVQHFSREDVDAVLNNGYGTVIGLEQQWAVLDFSPERMQYMSRLTWFDEVKQTMLENGWCRVEFAYNNDRELVRDILSHGSDVIVQFPTSLREQVHEAVLKMCSYYGSCSSTSGDLDITDTAFP